MKGIGFLVFIAFWIGLIMLVGVTDEKTAAHALKVQGFTQAEFTGYRFFTCGDDYWYHTGFKAKSITGEPVTGAVCSGFMKGSSIKVD